MPSQTFTIEQARGIGEQVGIDWDAAPFDVDQFRRGLEVELELMEEEARREGA